jgi:predicted aspartyl protease
MNTTFHMTGIDRAYTSLALTSSGKTLNAHIGLQRLEIEMASRETLEAAMRDLRRKMTISLSQTCAICAAWNTVTNQPERPR